MQDKYNPLESIATAIAFSPRDWSSNHRDAWIYGIVLGWDEDDLEELKKRYSWTNETVARLKFLHDEYKIKKNKNEELDRYLKALEEIENILASTSGKMRSKLYDYEQDAQILDIISKAKGI